MFKEFCYFDLETGDYVKLNCSLKDDVKEDDLAVFYNQLYSMKLDTTSEKKTNVDKSKNTGDLKICFFNMINSDELSFEGIYNLFESDTQRKSPRLAVAVESFLGMFEFEEDSRYSSEVFSVMLRNADSRMFSEDSPEFERHLRSSEYNTKMLMLTGCQPVISNKKTQNRHI